MAGIPGLGFVGATVGSVVRGARDQAEAIVRLPSTVVDTVDEVRAAARSARRVAERADRLLDDIEQPLRAVAPGLRRLADLLDDPVVADAPETLRRFRDDVLPAVRALRETQQRVAGFAGAEQLRGAAALFMRRAATRPDVTPGSVTATPPTATPPAGIPPTATPPSPGVDRRAIEPPSGPAGPDAPAD